MAIFLPPRVDAMHQSQSDSLFAVAALSFSVVFSRFTPVPRVFPKEYSSFVSYSHRADHLCPILTGLIICVLFSPKNVTLLGG